jgi:hypothetical protein
MDPWGTRLWVARSGKKEEKAQPSILAATSKLLYTAQVHPQSN